MDVIVLPLNIREVENLVILPAEVFNSDRYKITLEIFTIEEKRKVFGLPNLEVTKDENSIGFKCSGSLLPVDSNLVHEYITTNYKLTISGEFDQDEQCKEFLAALNFIFKIAIGSYFPVEYRNNFSFQYRRFQSFRKINKLSKEVFDKIKILIPLTLQQFSSNPKMGLLDALVEVAFTRFMKMRANGSFLVSILESIFVEDEGRNIKEKLAVRMTGKRGEDHNYKERIRKLYKSRCDFFHNGKGTFNEDDLIFLENEVFWAIEQYIKTPMDFNFQELESKYPLKTE